MKPRAPHARGGHDRWLVSYADLVTLLLALFTTLYAASTIDAQKLGPLSISLRQAFDTPAGAVGAAEQAGRGTSIVAPVTIVSTETGRDSLQVRLTRDLAEALRLDRLAMRRDERGLVLSLPEEAAFATARAEATPEALDLIRRIAEAVAPTASAIRVEGHTDDVPIRTARFASNWELSTARASAVVEFLVRSAGLPPERLSAAGYGEFHPRVPNDSPENRARNRRIDLVIVEGGRP